MFLRTIASVGIMALFSICALANDQAGSAPTHQQKTTAETPIHQRNCDAGKGDACSQIAFRHVLGQGGLAKDFVAAAAFYQRACDLGYVDGCTSLGKAYETGEGVPTDMTRAVQLYGKACEKGSSSACLYMGDAYAGGVGVAVDAGRAIAYFRKACVADKASLVCGYANDHMAMMQSPVAYHAGRCDAGDGDDCMVLGNLFADGKGVAVDHAQAADAFDKACQLGSGSAWIACNAVGAYYARGEGVTQDFARAVQFFERACNDRTVEGCVNLGSMYWNGTGVPQDTDRAAALNHQACAGGDAKGCDFMERVSVAIMGTPEQQKAENDAQERENRARGAEALQRAYEVNMGGLADHFQRESQVRADADAMLARINSQAASAQAQQVPQSSALADHSQLLAHPVAAPVPVSPASVSHPLPPSASMTSAGSGAVEMFVFFINLGGKTVAFEGPLALSRAEGNAMKARLEGEAPGRYGAGASVDARSRGGGWCAFVYQRPGEERYIMGSETTLSTATNSMKGMVNNLNAVIHHDVVCPSNN